MLTKERARDILVRRGNRWLHAPDVFLAYFEDGLRLLTKKGWTQGAYARSRWGHVLQSGKDKSAAKFCAQGALERVTPDFRDFKICRSLLSHALGVMPNGRWSIPVHQRRPVARA
jgi:hypothetical protein